VRCKPGKKKIDQHPTRDVASPAAANGPLRVALYRPGHTALCQCAAEQSDPKKCAALLIYDGDEHVATFHGTNFRAAEEQDPAGVGLSGLVVYRMPSGQTQDAAPQLAEGEKLFMRLQEINRRNAEFWEKRRAEE
jgi:hypothetical protein